MSQGTANPRSNGITENLKEPMKIDRAKLALKIGGWTGFFLIFLILFSLLKIPEIKIKSFVLGTIQSALAPSGVTFSPKETQFSLLMGLRLRFTEAQIQIPSLLQPILLDEIVVRPNFLGLLKLSPGIRLSVQMGKGEVHSALGISGKSQTIDLDIRQLDLGKSGLFPILGIKGSGLLEGSGKLEGIAEQLSTLTGSLSFKLAKTVLDQQDLFGFSLPQTAFSEGKIDLQFDKGKVLFKTFQLGKTGDDLSATVTGDITLAKGGSETSANLKVTAKFSPSLIASIPLLDAVLGSTKQADGSYVFKLAGPVSTLMPLPVDGAIVPPAPTTPAGTTNTSNGQPLQPAASGEGT